MLEEYIYCRGPPWTCLFHSVWLKNIATLVTEHTQVSHLSSLYSLSVMLSLGFSKVTLVIPCIRSISSDNLLSVSVKQLCFFNNLYS